MGRLRDLMPGRSVTRRLARAHRLLAAGSVHEAQRLVERGLTAHPGSSRLRELLLTIRRVATRARLQDLKRDVVHGRQPASFAQLIALYTELALHEDAQRTAEAFVATHPDHAHAQILLGALELETYLRDLDSRMGYEAHRHLERAVTLDPDAIKAWLLLTRLYWCVGAPRRLHAAREHLERLGGDQPDVQRVLEATAADADPEAAQSRADLLEGIEVSGRLAHDPSEWPLFTAQTSEARMQGDRALRAVRQALRREVADEIVILRTNGTVLAHGTRERGLIDEEEGLARVALTLERTLLQQVVELDLGALRRCTVQGPFGTVLLGEHHGEFVAARHARAIEPLRLWDRLAGALDTAAVAVEEEA